MVTHGILVPTISVRIRKPLPQNLQKEDIMSNIFDLMGMEVQDEEYESPNAGLNLRNIPVGGEFTANGIKFIRLGFEQGGILCITKKYVFFRVP